jgi:hypothetical protein
MKLLYLGEKRGTQQTGINKKKALVEGFNIRFSANLISVIGWFNYSSVLESE